MNWLFGLLAAFLVFLGGMLLFALIARILGPFAVQRGSAASAIARVRFLLAIIFLTAPVLTYLLWSPASPGKAAGQTITEVILITAGSLILLEGFAELFVLRFLSGRLGVGIPAIMVDVVKGILYITVILIVLHDFFSFDIKPFLTTSAIVTVIIGLSLQDTLGNLIAGLALHFAAPYRVGDWIQAGTLEGKILRIEWRSTLILTRTNDAIVIPHIVMAKNEIYNFSAPSARHARELKIPLDYRYPPDKVFRILKEVAENVEGILENPEPEPYLLAFENQRIVYSIWVWIEDFEHLPEILSTLARRIWYALEREESKLQPSEKYEIAFRPPASDNREEELATFLQQFSMFQQLDRELLKKLVSGAKLLSYSDGEKIIRQGEREQDFFVLHKGKAVVLKNDKSFYQYGPGEFFGEMALLTGEPRRATVQALGEASVIVFKKEVLAPFLESNPLFLESLSCAIEARLKTLPREELSAVEEGGTMQAESLGAYILKRIKSFFLQSS